MPDVLEAPAEKISAIDESLDDNRAKIADLDLFEHKRALQTAVDNEWITEHNRQEWMAWFEDSKVDPDTKKAALAKLQVKPGSDMAKQQQVAEERKALLEKRQNILKSHPELKDQIKVLDDKHKFFDVLSMDERKKLVTEIKDQAKDLAPSEVPDKDVEQKINEGVDNLEAAKSNGSISPESADKWIAWFKNPNTPTEHIKNNTHAQYLADHAPLAARKSMDFQKLATISTDSNFVSDVYKFTNDQAFYALSLPKRLALTRAMSIALGQPMVSTDQPEVDQPAVDDLKEYQGKPLPPAVYAAIAQAPEKLRQSYLDAADAGELAFKNFLRLTRNRVRDEGAVAGQTQFNERQQTQELDRLDEADATQLEEADQTDNSLYYDAANKQSRSMLMTQLRERSYENDYDTKLVALGVDRGVQDHAVEHNHWEMLKALKGEEVTPEPVKVTKESSNLKKEVPEEYVMAS